MQLLFRRALRFSFHPQISTTHTTRFISRFITDSYNFKWTFRKSNVAAPPPPMGWKLTTGAPRDGIFLIQVHRNQLPWKRKSYLLALRDTGHSSQAPRSDWNKFWTTILYSYVIEDNFQKINGRKISRLALTTKIKGITKTGLHRGTKVFGWWWGVGEGLVQIT